ncbi:MAG: type II secretion system protein [Gemmatales bacterium]|nr:type II secretion system GspH family protein [Gemmatales bacterium]MDW7995816.1 type II secretion system protein [Gemmatales bacterium]
MRSGQASGRIGFTLVEVLVAVAIIGTLMALLFPAIQRVRESANRARCASNLQQLALAFYTHASQRGMILPTGGSPTPPNQSTPTNDGWGRQITEELDKNLQILYCPSRRRVGVFGNGTQQTDYVGVGNIFASITITDKNVCNGCLVPWFQNQPPGQQICRRVSITNDIPDGRATTLLLAEKSIDRKAMEAARDLHGDYWGYAFGWPPGPRAPNGQTTQGFDTLRWPQTQPFQDTYTGTTPSYTFGSGHLGTFNAVSADQSLRRIRYTVDLNVLRAACTRNGGENVDLRQLE